MKKHYLLSAIAAIALTSCSSDEFLGIDSPSVDTDNTAPIGFFSDANRVTRATHEESAKLLHNNFVVFGESFNGSAATTIFDNYVVQYGAQTAGSATDNTHDWHYAGLTSLEGASQDVKYWNYSTDKYQFVAASGLTGEKFASTDKGLRINVPNADALTSIYVSDRATATPTAQAATSSAPASSAYQDVVTLNFRRLGAQMRIGFYETVPGYAVKDLVFYYVGAPSGSYTVGVGGAFPKSGRYSVTYNDATNAAEAEFAGASNNTEFSKTFGKLDYVGAESRFLNDPSKKYISASGVPQATADKVFLGTSAANATFGKGVYTIDGTPGVTSDYRPILPNEDNSLKLQMRVDYTLVALDGSGEELQVRDAYVSVPVEYTKWKPNYSYTYLFKITSMTNGYTGVGGGGTPDPDPNNPGRLPDPDNGGGDNDPVIDPITGEVIPPYVPDPNDPNPTIPNPDYDPQAPPTVPNPDAQPEIPNPGFDPTQPVGPDNPENIPNPDYDPQAPPTIPNPDAQPEIPNPDVPLVPNPDYPVGPKGDQHDPSNPVPVPEDPNNPGNPDPQNPASLYPITFDAVVIDAQEYKQETITTVATPCITTYAKDSNVTTNDEYKVGENITLSATIDAGALSIEGWSYAVSATEITESKAATIAGSLTWNPLAGPTLTPAAAGYHIVRLTYNGGKVAYKVVKVVD